MNIREIQNHRAFTLSFEENYRLAYYMVVNKQGETLYNGVVDLVTENLNRLADEIIVPAFPSGMDGDPMHSSQEAERLLKALRRVWEDHTESMSLLSQILKYMVRPCTAHTARVYPCATDVRRTVCTQNPRRSPRSSRPV